MFETFAAVAVVAVALVDGQVNWMLQVCNSHLLSLQLVAVVPVLVFEQMGFLVKATLKFGDLQRENLNWVIADVGFGEVVSKDYSNWPDGCFY